MQIIGGPKLRYPTDVAIHPFLTYCSFSRVSILGERSFHYLYLTLPALGSISLLTIPYLPIRTVIIRTPSAPDRGDSCLFNRPLSFTDKPRNRAFRRRTKSIFCGFFPFTGCRYVVIFRFPDVVIFYDTDRPIVRWPCSRHVAG